MSAPKTFRRRRLVAAILVVLIGAHVAPLLITHPEQDACSFGPVSNARYRELLSEAKRRQGSIWPPLVRDQYKASVLLKARFDDLIGRSTNVYERIAGMHAILRALGADYRRASSGRFDPYERSMQFPGVVGFDYHIDINRLGFFGLFWRRGLLVGNIASSDIKDPGQTTSTVRVQQGDISIAAIFPKLLETYHFVPRSEFGEVCPPVPTPEQAERFTPEYR